MARRTPFGRQTEEEPSFVIKKAVISSVNEVVSGGILRSGKRDFGDNYTGWWLGRDTDGNPKLDITFDDDSYIRFSHEGIAIAADGSAMTNIDGSQVQAGSITGTAIANNSIATAHLQANSVTAAEINVATLSAVSSSTGALNVTSTLTMGETGSITWADGAAQITQDDILIVMSTNFDGHTIRYLDTEDNHLGNVSVFKSDQLMRLAIAARGPSATGTYGKVSLDAYDAPACNYYASMWLDSDLGIRLHTASAKPGAIIELAGQVHIGSDITWGLLAEKPWNTGYYMGDDSWRICGGDDLYTYPHFVLLPSGDLGLGASPGYAFHCYRNGSNAAGVFEREGGAINYINATANYGNFGTVNAKPLRLMYSGTWRVIVDSTDVTLREDIGLILENGSGSIGLGTTDYGDGAQVLAIANAATNPTSAPTGGGVLYVDNGALKYIGSSGTVTPIAPA